MTKKNQGQPDLSRRRLLAHTGIIAAGAALSSGISAQTPSESSRPAWGQPFTGVIPETLPRGYNILLITTDQEHYFETYPFPVPGRERLIKTGTTFTNHQINSAICTPSRSVLHTGFHMPQTRMFDNLGLPWMPWDLAPELSLGHVMKQLGYYCAYKGKWHLTKALEEPFEGLHSHDPSDIRKDKLHQKMQEYGFEDYHGAGDIIGLHQGGYYYDGVIGSQAINWLRSKGRLMADKNQPWFMTVSLVNPHDVMFIDTDAPGEKVQWRKSLNSDNPMAPARPPENALYQQRWPEVPLPDSRHQPFDETGRPAAHGEYQRARAAMVGQFPDEDRRWRKLQDYYFNCIRDCDRNLTIVLDELDALNLTNKTIVVFTSDHGELAGYHQMHGKGSSVYRQQVHVPMIISHPAYPGGQRCRALSCHLDLVPTLAGLTGLPQAQLCQALQALGKRKGKDFSVLLHEPTVARSGQLRSTSLYCYNMMLYADANYLAKFRALKDNPHLTADQVKARIRQLSPNYQHRSAIRMIYDGRYKFARYFSLKQHNMPQNWEQLLAYNDLELYDLQTDPGERHNLACSPERHKELIMHLSNQLNALYRAEIGEDDGQFMPALDGEPWDLTMTQFQQMAND